MATIKDIARELNISTSTVSYALNGGPRQVPDSVRERVLEMARKLNYRPNRLARSLVTGQSGGFGLVAGDNVRLLHELAAQGRLAGEDLLLINPAQNAVAETIAFALMDGRIDGVIFVEEVHDPLVPVMLAEQGFPYVLLAVEGEGTSIRANLAQGLKSAMEHLLALGHTRTACVTGPLNLTATREQADEFRGAHSDNGIECIAELLLDGPLTFEGGYQAGKRLLSPQVRPTAVLAGSDEIAFGVCHAAREAGLELPRDLSIVGIGDSSLCHAFHPALTTIRIPYAEMAAAALSAIWMMCRAKEVPESQTFATELVVRGSTARPSRAPVALKRFDRDRLRGLS